MSKIIDAKKNGYQITYTGEKAERFIRPNGEYQQLSYGDGTTTVSSHKADGTKTAQDSMSFDKNTGKILKKTDANGIESSYSYDDGGKDGEQNGWVNEYLVRKIKTEVDYQELDAAGLVKFLKTNKEKEETFTIASIEYNENDDVISETEENGDITSSEYEDEKNPYLPTSETTTNGNDFISQTVYEYDPKGNVISETDKGENKKEETKTVTSYDDHGQPTTVTTTKEGAPDSVEQTTYRDTVQGTTQGEEKETSVTKTDAMGRETENTSKDRKGNILSSTETSYDFMGRAIQTKVTSDGVTQTESKTYDDNGTVATETSASGIKTAYRYDSLNRVIKATESVDGTDTVTETSYGYEDAQIHTLNGTKDYQDLSVQTTKTNGRVSEKSWTDAAGQTVRSFSHGLYTDHVFTSDGKEIATISLGTKTSGDGKIALQLYDKEGKQTAAIQNPEITKGTSDAVVKVGNSSILQKTEYDTKGNETTKTDGNGDQISYAYDDQNRVTEITQGGQKTKVSYQVNSDGSTTTSVTDANGHVKQETASASGSVTTTSDLGDGSESITTKYTYDDRGNKLSEVYANGAKKTYEYNNRNLVTKTQSYDKEGTKTLTSRYRYDDKGQLSEMTDYSVSSETETAYRYTEYSYDTRGRITTFAEISQNAQPTADDIKAHQIRYIYNEDGNLSKVSYPTTKDGIQSLSYTYDAYGKVKAIKDHRNLLNNSDQAVQKVYTYDSFDRVKEMTYTDLETGKVMESYQYSYDKNSNIIEKIAVNNYPKEDPDKVNETKSYTYNGLDQLKTSTKEKGTAVEEVRQYDYDANGNQTDVKNTKTGENQTYVYDAENRLSQVSVTKDRKTAVIQQNSYNGEGQRIQKIDGDETTNYYYQNGVVAYTTDTDGNQNSQNLIGTDGNVLATERFQQNATQYYLYNKDIQGGTSSLVKEDGSADATYQYTDFGETTIQGDDQAKNEVCYTGGIYDQSTGLYYLNARYYNPEDGRFMTEDSYRGEIMKPETGHLYVYCANNPVNYVDPSGHFEIAVPVLVKLVLVGGTVIYVSYSTWKDHSPKTRYDGRRISYRSTIFRWIVAKAIRHGIKKYAEHTTNQTKANKQKHQKANARRQREQGGDKKRNKKGWKSRK